MIEQGIDRAFTKKTTKLAALTAESVKDLANEFSTRYVEVHRKRPEQVKQMMDADILRRLGAHKVKDITRRHIDALTLIVPVSSLVDGI